MDNYYFFWNGVFSQWYQSKFYDPLTKMTFNCCEQYMMYKKAEVFGDTETMKLIMATLDPRTQKQLGRNVKGYDEDKWNEVCRNLVAYGNYLKFSQNEELKQFLLATGDLILVEASPYDAKWGIGMGAGDPNINDTSKWGLNWLGEAIMDARTKLKSEVK